MTATYDGRLRFVMAGSSARMEACCRQMDERAMAGQVYAGKKGIMLRDPANPRVGYQIVRCPFCGAEVVQ